MTLTTDIRLIALDIDGTLLTSNRLITEETHRTIQAAQEKGVHVMLSTGRPFDHANAIAEELGLRAPLVTVNGGEVWSSDKTLLERHVHDTQVMKELWTYGYELDVRMWLAASEALFAGGHYPSINNFDDYTWLKIGFSTPDVEKLTKIKDKLNQYDTLEVTNSQPMNLEVNPLGVNKAEGLKRVCEKLEITMDQVMAVGDSLNDLKMIEQSGIGVAMGNAQDYVKVVADYTTLSNNDDGVAEAIKRFVL